MYNRGILHLKIIQKRDFEVIIDIGKFKFFSSNFQLQPQTKRRNPINYEKARILYINKLKNYQTINPLIYINPNHKVNRGIRIQNCEKRNLSINESNKISNKPFNHLINHINILSARSASTQLLNY